MIDANAENNPARDWRAEIAERNAGIDALLSRLKITMSVEFVPCSKAPKWDTEPGKAPPLTLNWRVTILRDGRKVLTTPYSAGIAHAPSYKQRMNHQEAACVAAECETGFASRYIGTMGKAIACTPRKPILPELRDIVHSLLSDSDAIDYPTYEEWAYGLGYEPDSRKGERIYRACLEIALKLRAALGETVLAELRDAYQDY